VTWQGLRSVLNPPFRPQRARFSPLTLALAAPYSPAFPLSSPLQANGRRGCRCRPLSRPAPYAPPSPPFSACTPFRGVSRGRAHKWGGGGACGQGGGGCVRTGGVCVRTGGWCTRERADARAPPPLPPFAHNWGDRGCTRTGGNGNPPGPRAIPAAARCYSRLACRGNTQPGAAREWEARAPPYLGPPPGPSPHSCPRTRPPACYPELLRMIIGGHRGSRRQGTRNHLLNRGGGGAERGGMWRCASGFTVT
jgi:hypothetical protein